MLLITCPFCGPRDESEFACGGEAHIVRPADPAALTDAQWADYLFMRKNVKGVHFERWMHSHGCRRWFNAARDTVTHQFLAFYKMGEQAPDIAPVSYTARPAPRTDPALPADPALHTDREGAR